MTPYSYGTMFQDLQSWNEDYSADLQSELPRIIQNGELRCLRDMDLDLLDYQVATDAIDQTTAIVDKPGNMVRDRVLVLTDATPAAVTVLVKRTFDFVLEYNIANGVTVGPPKYYGEYSPTQWIVAPVPDQAYTINVRGIFPSPLLGDNDEDNSPAAVVALQNTVANTALTLTTSPYAITPEALPLSLTSTGNMSGNAFTIVGLDSDGNDLTVTISGPDANAVTTEEYWTQITSITPSATDAVNEVSVGFYSANTTWLSTRFPDLLFSACMIEATGYLKRFSAQAVAKNDYADKLADALQETRNMQRSDLDDIFLARQLVNGPPRETIVPPTSTTAQQPQPGSQ